MNDKSPDWNVLAKKADYFVFLLHRSVASVDRFNPTYLVLFGTVLVALAGIAAAYAVDVQFQSVSGIVRLTLCGAVGLLCAVASGFAFREAFKFRTRWHRAKLALARTLKDAEMLAALGFVTTDKLGSSAEEETMLKQKLIQLQDAIRDCHERL
jgi:uncharacterized membrane protein